MPDSSHSIPLADEVREIRQALRERGDMVIETQMQVVALADTFSRFYSSLDDLRKRGDRQFWLILGSVLIAPPATVMGSAAALSPQQPTPIQQTVVSPQDLARMLIDFNKHGIEIPGLDAHAPLPIPRPQNP